ncbi:hypothetical protein [Actinoplanes sp. NPDC051411]|uniref:hypothetical protein n=1 Tax=Actinoplanes sp. NPDC051411 TaxID=3155522 RepID=UPI00343EECB4
MSKLSQAVVMLLFGGSLLKVTLTDVFLRYVKAGLKPCLVVAGVLLVAAAVMTIWYELRASATGTAMGIMNPRSAGCWSCRRSGCCW